jgi:hypothetical protein
MALTVVAAADELSADEGSLVDEEIDAVFVAVPADEGAVIETVIAGAAPVESDARVQITVVVPVQAQPEPVADTSAAPAGSTSVTDTEVAVDGPAFATLSV